MICFEMLSADNIDEVWELEKQCFDDPWERSAFESEIDNRISVYIAARDSECGKIIGYAGVWMMYDCANITNIAVHADWRCEGIGRRLLDTLIDASIECGMREITLEVRVSNSAATALYEKCGFVKCGLRKRYYKDREDALIMTKNLKDIRTEV